MTTTLKYLSSLALIIALIGCQNDSSNESPQQPPQQSQQQQQPQQQPGQMGQMQQSAPEVDLSDEEADKFADAAINAQEVQMEGQKKMMGIIEDEGLDVNTYQKIAQSAQQGQTPEDSGVSEDDMKKFQSATESIQQVQGEIQKEISAVVEEAGMGMERFRKISQAAQQDRALQQQIRQKIQEKMGDNPEMQQPPTGN